MRKIRLIVSLALPVCMLLGLILKTEVDINQGKKLRLPIEGYDPRDLLRGHYINFRFRWDFDEDKTRKFISINERYYVKDVHICIPSTKKVYPVMSLDDDANCEFRILGQLRTNTNTPRFDFVLGIEKFYVPEKYSKLIEDEFRSKKGEAELAVNSQSRAIITELFIDGISWKRITSE